MFQCFAINGMEQYKNLSKLPTYTKNPKRCEPRNQNAVSYR